MTTAADHVAWREILNRKYGASLAMVCLGVWLHAADSLLVSTMMPAIVADIGGVHLISWTVALYEIGSIIAGAASGLLALRYGLGKPMTSAAGLFALGCLLSALAPTMPVLLAGRLLQGFGGGGLMALSFVAAGLLFPQRTVARVMGAVSTLWATSAFLGPLIGGLFVEFATWRAGFGFFAVQALFLMLWLARRKSGEAAAAPTSPGNLPVMRLLWLSAAVVAIAYGGIEIALIRTSALALLGILCLLVFLGLEARSENRLLPKNPISLRQPIGAALTMILCFAAGTIALSIYGPLLMTRLHDTPILVAGYILALEAIAWAATAALLSGSPERRDPLLIVLGMAMVTTSIPTLAFAVPFGPVWLIALAAALQGAGFGMAWTFILRRATAIAPSGEAERISAAIPTVQRLGYALGAAYIGLIANATGIDGIGSSLKVPATVIFLASLPLAVIGLIAATRFVRSDDLSIHQTAQTGGRRVSG